MTDPSRIRLVPETGSTNADLRAQAADWPEGTWLRAERQSAGRGRLGRAWQSPAGNLYTSTLIRLLPSDPSIAGLSLMLGVAVQTALATLLPDAPIQLKWPNDILSGRAKLAGMLLEREGEAVIAGVGINVTSAPQLADRPTIALADLPGGAMITAAQVLDQIIPTLDHWLALWRDGGMSAIIPAWLARAHPLGTSLIVTTGAQPPQHGRFLGLNPTGALILARDDGTGQIIHSGDVGILP